MKVRVRLFAAAKQAIGQEMIEISVPDGATVATLRRTLADEYPQLHRLLTVSLFAVGCQYAQDSTQLTSDAEVAWIPPVSGG